MQIDRENASINILKRATAGHAGSCARKIYNTTGIASCIAREHTLQSAEEAPTFTVGEDVTNGEDINFVGITSDQLDNIETIICDILLHLKV